MSSSHQSYQEEVAAVAAAVAAAAAPPAAADEVASVDEDWESQDVSTSDVRSTRIVQYKSIRCKFISPKP